jgi:hypothetical protein
MVEQIQTEFYSSLAQFTEHGFTEANAYKSKLEEAGASYDAALTKIDEMSKKGKLDESKMNSVLLPLLFPSPSLSTRIKGRLRKVAQNSAPTPPSPSVLLLRFSFPYSRLPSF